MHYEAQVTFTLTNNRPIYNLKTLNTFNNSNTKELKILISHNLLTVSRTMYDILYFYLYTTGGKSSFQIILKIICIWIKTMTYHISFLRRLIWNLRPIALLLWPVMVAEQFPIILGDSGVMSDVIRGHTSNVNAFFPTFLLLVAESFLRIVVPVVLFCQ